MGTGLGTKTKAASKTSTGPRSTFVSASAALLEICNTEIGAQLEAQIRWNPSIMIDEGDFLKRGGDSDPYEEEPDVGDVYDPPDMEKNIETGEGANGVASFLEQAESFMQFVQRRVEEDFDPVDDARDIERINKIFNKFNPEEFSASGIPDDLKPWIESLLREFPSWKSFGSHSLEPGADIIFYGYGHQVNYEINLGILDRIRFNKDASINNPMSLSISGYDFSPAWLRTLIQARRDGLCLLAKFLIENQAAFIQAENFNTAIERLRSIRHVDLLKYVNQEDIKNVFRFNKNKELSWAHRVIKNKWIKVPFSEDFFPAKLFFDEHIGAINVLRKAIELHVIKENKSPLKAPEQCVILKALCDQKVQAQTICKIIWPHLRKIYPEKEWRDLGIMGVPGRPATGDSIDDSALAKLINHIGKELKIPGTEFSQEHVREIKNEIYVQ